MGENKIKQTSVRYFENDLEKISELASQMDVSTAEVIKEWRKAYERIKLEETSTHGQNLKALREYLTHVEQLFQTIVNTSELNVKSEQDRALENEQKLREHEEKSRNTIQTIEMMTKEQKKEIDSLTKELKRYEALEESTESRILDKDQLILSRNENILALTQEIKELKEENRSVNELQSQMAHLHTQISELQEAAKAREFDFNMELKQKDMDRQQALISLREEFQDKYEARIEQIYDEENEKREMVRETLETRLREAHAKELDDMRARHQEEINQIEERHRKE